MVILWIPNLSLKYTNYLDQDAAWQILCCVLLSCNVLQLYFFILLQLSNVVVMHCHVLCSLLENMIFCQLQNILIIRVNVMSLLGNLGKSAFWQRFSLPTRAHSSSIQSSESLSAAIEGVNILILDDMPIQTLGEQIISY